MELFRKKKPSNSVTFFCFNPAVSFSTFVIEFIFAFYVFFKYKATLFRNLCVITLLCLGLFQLSEFMICKTPYEDFAVKMGYISITLLPALGIHIATLITKRWKAFIYLAYLSAALLIITIVFVPAVAFIAACQPNYVNIGSSTIFSDLHTLYYGVFMLLGISMLTLSLFKKVGDSKQEKWMILSYLVFMVPSMVLSYMKLIENMAVPSIMCGLALITALIFVFIIIPRYYKKDKS
jgi:hypothetical protein